jgi:hypothetical protein
MSSSSQQRGSSHGGAQRFYLLVLQQALVSLPSAVRSVILCMGSCANSSHAKAAEMSLR